MSKKPEHKKRDPNDPIKVRASHASEMPLSMWGYFALGLACMMIAYLGLQAYQFVTSGSGLFAHLGAIEMPAQKQEPTIVSNSISTIANKQKRVEAKQQKEEENKKELVENEPANLAGLMQVYEDASLVSAERASAIASNPESYTSNVEEILQYPLLPSGCEPVSLTIVLRSMGFDIEAPDFIDNYLVDEKAAEVGYNGSPYGNGGALPYAMVKAANSFLTDQGSNMHAYDLTGTSFEGLVALTQEGYPVMLWTTMYMEEPEFQGEMDNGLAWWTSEHCVVMYGVDGDRVLVSDPLEGLVERNRDDFVRIYERCGQLAAYISQPS